MDPADNETEDQLEGYDEDREVVVEDEVRTDDDSGTDDGDQGSGGEPAGAEPLHKPTRKERQRIRQQEHENRIREAVRQEYQGQMSAMQNQLADLTNRLGQTTERMVEVVDRSTRPPEKSVREQASERIRRAAAGINKEDPATMERFLDEQLAAAEELADDRARQIVQEEIGKFRQTLPKPQSQEDAAYHAMAPWLNKPAMKQAVQLEINRLATKQGRNLRDDKVWDTTVREAIANVATQWDLPVHGGSSNGSNGKPPASVMGANGRGGGGGGGGGNVAAIPYTPLMIQAADGHPKFGKLPKDRRYREYYKHEVAPYLPK